MCVSLRLTAARATPATKIRTTLQWPAPALVSARTGHTTPLIVLVSPAPLLVVKFDGTPIADNDLSPSTADGTDFGTVATMQGRTRQFTVHNEGTSAATFPNNPVVVVSGTHSTDFVVTPANLPATLAPGANFVFDVAFSSTELGLRQASLSIANNDLPRNPYNFALQANSVGALP